MPASSHKKALLVSSYAPPAIGGPNNLYCLLRDTKPEEFDYTILTSFYNIDALSAKVGNWLPGDYAFYDKPSATKQEAQNPAATTGQTGRSAVAKLKHLMKRVAVIRALAGIPVILSQILAIYRTGKKVALAKNSELIMAFSDYGPALISSYFLHKKTKLPLYLFMFDLYQGNFFPFPGGPLARIFEPKLFKAAEKIVVTNDGTKAFYVKRYGESVADKIHVIHNAAFGGAYKELATTYDPKPPYTILFTGRIYWPQIGALKNLVKAVEEMNDPNFTLKFYCPNPKEYLKRIGIDSPKIEWSVAAPKEMPAIQSSADILFLPLSWGTKSQQIIDTATPGKLTDYLAAGRPMLIHAPATSTLVAYAKQRQFAEVVDTEDTRALQVAIRKIVSDIPASRKLVENAKKTFDENHEATANAKKFLAIFRR
jgi:glycosyltransferase involved in cell wall biosynthesis